MKKRNLLFGVMSLGVIAVLASCGGTTASSTKANPSSTVTTTTTVKPTATTTVKPTATTETKKVLSYSEYVKAENSQVVTIEGYVQGKQSWWSDKGVGKATLYLADHDGAYFVYDLQMSEDQYKALTIGIKIRVTGVKGEWSGEVEILGSEAGSEATFEVLSGDTYIAEAKPMSKDSVLINYMNQKVSFSNLTVIAQNDGTSPFYYKWNGSGTAGTNSDVYYTVTDGVNTYSFTVESYLCAEGTDVYTAATSLKLGDVISVEGFLYWYNGAQLHTTSIKKTNNVLTKSEGVMTYNEYIAAESNSDVTIEAFVQGKQSWWSDKGVGKATLYLADQDGAYFVYELQMSEDQYKALTIGTKVKVTGVKGEWSGEVEILGSQAGSEANFDIIPNQYYIAVAKPMSKDSVLINYMNQKVSFTNLKVVAQNDGTSAFYYKWNGSGAKGNNDDLYFSVTDGVNTYTFTVESYLCAEGTDVYTAVENLKVGDVISLEGFLYWYNGAQLHTTKVTVSK